MRHDIRTPMNAIMGMTALASQENKSEKVGAYLEKIDTSSKFLLELINDILDMARIERGRVDLHPQNYPMDEFKSLIFSTAKVLAEKKNIHFCYVPDSSVDCIYVDRLRFNQIILNLLSNAVKFTPDGGTVTLTWSVMERSGRDLKLRCVVQDTGIGISPEFLPLLFDPFAQESKQHVNIQEGSGLGLAIVRRLVTALHGDISVESEPSKGSAFTVVLPVQLGETADQPASPAQLDEVLLQGRKVLVVEDNEINQEVVQQILALYGVDCVLASNGQEALDRVTSSADKEFDAILMDIRMPVMDGMEAAQRLRRLDRPDVAAIPVIALTADAYIDEQQRIMNSGMTAYLAKPVAPEMLVNMLRQVLQ
jgi:CheY-like chemotaxis protein